MRTFTVLAIAVGLLAGCVADRKSERAPQSVSVAPTGQSQPIMQAPVSSVREYPLEVSQFTSFQPFFTPSKGAGQGYAYEYYNRTKVQLIALLRSPQLMKKQSRVSCERLVQQLVQVHAALNLPFEGCEGAADALRSDDFRVELCRDEMFERDNRISLTNARSTQFGVWHRQCLREGDKIVEQVLTYKGKVLMSMRCLNVAVPLTERRTATLALPVTIGHCPTGFRLKLNAWAEESLSADQLRRADSLIAAATNRPTLSSPQPDFSNVLGGTLRTQVKVQASVNDEVLVQYLPVAGESETFSHKAVLSNGLAEILLPGDPRSRIIKTVWPTRYRSPTVFQGERQLLLFGQEWGPHCTLNLHGLVRRS